MNTAALKAALAKVEADFAAAKAAVLKDASYVQALALTVRANYKPAGLGAVVGLVLPFVLKHVL